MSRTAIVILNYNGEKLLRQFLPIVIRCSGDADIIVADNASTDQSTTLVQREFPGVRIVQLDANYGYAGGYNHALKEIDADYFVLLNSDVEVTPGWLTPLTELLDQHVDIAAVQPKILSYHHRERFEYAGAAGGFIDVLGYPFCRGRLLNTTEEDHGQYDQACDIFWASGACFIIRSSVFTSVGGFDTDFFAHMEEIDLCWKIHRLPLRVHFTPKSVVYHVGAGTLPYGNARKVYLNFRNGLSMLYKHLSWRSLVPLFAVRIGLDWVAALHFLLTGQAAAAWAVCRAHAAFIAAWPEMQRKRQKVQQFKGYDASTVRKRVLVVDYFVFRRKRFSELT